MGHTYCSRLSTDSTTPFVPNYGYPFAGFVNFTDNDKANPFEESQDYLQRWDTGNGMNEPVKGTAMCSETNGTCVKINDMYCSTLRDFQYRNQESFDGDGNRNKVFLSMVPLAKSIRSDDSGLSFIMDMGSEIKTQKTIALPFSTGISKNVCNLDFCAAGFCKSNIPYIGLEYISRMMNSGLQKNENDDYYTLYSSGEFDNIFGASESVTLTSEQVSGEFVKTYEWPGQGSILLNPYSLIKDNLSSDSSLISDTYDNENDNTCLAYKICKSICDAIKNITGISSDGEIQRYYASGYLYYGITFNEDVSNDAKWSKLTAYIDLLDKAGAVYYKKDDGTFEKQNYLNINIVFAGGNGNTLTVGIGGNSGDICSLYGNSLSYYLNKGEKFKIGSTKYNASDIEAGKYLYAIRSINDTFLPSGTNMYTCAMATSFLNKCNSSNEVGALYNRMDLYPNISGSMSFFGSSNLNKNSYTGEDSSTFKPLTKQYGYSYINYIPAFSGTPSWDSSNSRMSNMGVIEDNVEIKFDGTLYVSEVRLVFEGKDIAELSESSTISVGGNKKNVRTDGNNVSGNKEFTFTFGKSDSPVKISSSNGKAIRSGDMKVYTVGAQQMLKYCSFPGHIESINTSFDSIYRLDAKTSYNASLGNVNPEDSQMTFTKITGRIPVSISGSGKYKSDNINVKLISAYVTLTDDSSLGVHVYSLGIKESTGYPSRALSWMGSNALKFVSPEKVNLSYSIHRPFLGAMSGDIPRYTSSSDDSSLYNMGVSSFTSEDDRYKSKIGLDSSNNVICVGPNYSESSANGGTNKTFSDYSSAYATDLSFSRLTYDLGLEKSDGTEVSSDTRGISVGANSVYYSVSKNPFGGSTSIENQLNNNGSYIKFSLPEPHLNAILVYDSVEFNRASAWTFMRSMPLQPGSAEAPHILIYKVEAWVTEEGKNTVDEDSTKTMSFDYATSAIFSGYSSSANSKLEKKDGYYLCVKGINEAIEQENIINNCYLKVDDNGNTEDLNAVGTAFPIKDITGNTDFYGAESLNAKIYSNITDFGEDIYNNDGKIYNELFRRAKNAVSEDTQVVVLAYCHPVLKESSSGSGAKHKDIYICVGFYNSKEEMIPINGKFGFKYSVTTSNGNHTDYNTYMYLSEFFPKNSMIYLAGKNYKENTENVDNNRFAFVTNEIKNTYTTLSGDGINSGVPDNSEIINIGPDKPGSEMSYEIASSSNSKGKWEDVKVPDASVTPGLKPEHYTGHYGILNKYSGKVSFVSSVPYTGYTEYTDSLEGKCLLMHEHICYFPNATGVVTLL